MALELTTSYESQDKEVGFDYRNRFGNALAAVTQIDGSCLAGAYKFEFLDGTTIKCEAGTAQDRLNPLLFASKTVVCDGVTENIDVLPGFSFVFRSSSVAGYQFDLVVGGFFDGTEPIQVLNLGNIFGSVETSQKTFSFKNPLAAMTGCFAIASNGVRVENSGTRTPFLALWQEGILNPTADPDGTGQAITFAESDTLVNCIPVMTAVDAPIPYGITADSEVTGFEAWKVGDRDDDTYWKSAAEPTEVAPVRMIIDIGTGRSLQFAELVFKAVNDTDADVRCFPSLVDIEWDPGTGSWWSLDADVVLEDPEESGEVIVTFDTIRTGGRLRLSFTDTNGTGGYTALAGIELRCVTAQLLIDDVAAAVEDIYGEEFIDGSVLPDGYTQYIFPDGGPLQSICFIISDDWQLTDTATLYVSDAGSILQFVDSDGNEHGGSSGMYLTDDLDVEGEVAADTAIAFGLKVDSSVASYFGLRFFSFRVVGYVSGVLSQIEILGSFYLVDASLSSGMTWKIQGIKAQYEDYDQVLTILEDCGITFITN